MICVEHVTGDEKYQCDMLNVFVMESRRFCGRVCCAVLGGIFSIFWGYIFGRAI